MCRTLYISHTCMFCVVVAIATKMSNFCHPTRDVELFCRPKQTGRLCVEKNVDISCWLVVAMGTSLAKTHDHMYTAAQRYRSLPTITDMMPTRDVELFCHPKPCTGNSKHSCAADTPRLSEAITVLHVLDAFHAE